MRAADLLLQLALARLDLGALGLGLGDRVARLAQLALDLLQDADGLRALAAQRRHLGVEVLDHGFHLAELGLEVLERDIDRTELYVCDEAFFCGSGHEVSPINSIDHYPVGTGEPGPITRQLQKLYFDVVTGTVPKYRHWLTPVYGAARSAAAE